MEQGNATYAQVRLAEFFASLDDDTDSPHYLAEENNILRLGGERYMRAVDTLFRRTLVGKQEDVGFHFTDVWLWAGPKGVRTGLHADWDPTNILHHLYGRKTLWLIPPQQTAACYPSEKFDLGATIASVDPFQPDLMRFPKYAQVSLLRVDLLPGDTVQVPAGWMHYAQCDTGCVSLSGRSFSLSQTLTVLPTIAGSVLHRFGLYGMQGGSTSGYVGSGSSGPTVAPAGVWERLRNVSWYRAQEEYL